MAVINGKAYWASVQAPNDKFPPPKYEMDVVVDEATAEVLRADGLTVKDKEGQGLTFKVKRNQFRKDGTLNNKPNCVDANKRPFEDLIGNGSVVNVQYNPFDWEFAGKTGRSADFVGVQVMEHVAFSGTSDEFEAVAGTPDVADGDFDDEF